MNSTPGSLLLSPLAVAVSMLFVSCNSSTDPSTSGDTNNQKFSDYKIVRMHQEDDRNWKGSVEVEFLSACETLLKDGWIPAGNVTIHYKDADSWRTPMGYTQAFYR